MSNISVAIRIRAAISTSVIKSVLYKNASILKDLLDSTSKSYWSDERVKDLYIMYNKDMLSVLYIHSQIHHLSLSQSTSALLPPPPPYGYTTSKTTLSHPSSCPTFP